MAAGVPTDSAQCPVHGRCSVTCDPLLWGAQHLQVGGPSEVRLYSRQELGVRTNRLSLVLKPPRAREFEDDEIEANRIAKLNFNFQNTFPSPPGWREKR